MRRSRRVRSRGAVPPATGHHCDQADRPAARPHELLLCYFECFSLGWRPEKTFEISGNVWPLPWPSGSRAKYKVALVGSLSNCNERAIDTLSL